MASFVDILNKLADGENLEFEEASGALKEIISGNIPEVQIAAFLFGMRAKKETIQELTAFVKVMRDASVKVEVDIDHAVDLCGTGGDRSNTFNISTASMFVAAGAGVPVLKHGNRSVSSKSGSADVLEALGAVAALRKDEVEKVFNETGLAFMFAPFFHPAMKQVIPVRGGLKLRTFFNILGPLLNPAGVKRQVVGAYSKDVAKTIVAILANFDTEFAYGINASDGLDEFSINSITDVFELNENNSEKVMHFDPQTLGFEPAGHESLIGGDSKVNSEIIRAIVQDKSTKAQQDIVALNATFAIHVSGLAENLEQAQKMALESIKSGKALKKLDDFVTCTNDVNSSN